MSNLNVVSILKEHLIGTKSATHSSSHFILMIKFGYAQIEIAIIFLMFSLKLSFPTSRKSLLEKRN